MVVVRILGLVALVLSVSNANASVTGGLMTSEDLDAYADRIDFLNCAYGMPSTITDCSGSTAGARSAALGYSDQQAAGLNASKKAALDAALAGLLPKINEQDVSDYLMYFSALPESKQIDEYAPDALITFKMTVPGERTMDMAVSKDFENQDANKDSETQEFVYTVDELRELNKGLDSYENTGNYKPRTIQGLNPRVNSAKNQSLSFKNEMTIAEVTMKSSKDDIGVSLRTNVTSVAVLRRYPEFNYAIKIAKSDSSMIQQMEEGVYDENKLPRKEINVVEFKSGTPDYGWINRYSASEAVDRKSRHKDANFRVLEFGIDRADSYYEKYKNKIMTADAMSKLSEKEREKITRLVDLYSTKARSFHKAAERQYYIMKVYYGSDPKVRELLVRYENFKFANIGPMPNDLDKEEDFFNE
jgi:predicted DNA binding CopG/RHH family protein